MSRNRMNNQDYLGTLPGRQSQISAPGTSSSRQSGRPTTHVLRHTCVWGIKSWALLGLRAVGAVNVYKSLLLVAVATAALNYDKIRAPLKNVVVDAAAGLTCPTRREVHALPPTVQQEEDERRSGRASERHSAGQSAAADGLLPER